MNTEKATNLIDMRASNALLIMDLIRSEPCSRASIAKRTGLSRSAVTIIIDSLIQRGMVEETTVSKNGMGRKAMDLRICPQAAYVLGVHLKGEMYRIGVFNFSGELLLLRSKEYNKALTSAAQLICIGKDLLSLVQEEGIAPEKVLGVGVCASGPVDVHAGKVVRASSGWHEIEIVKVLESMLPWRCFLENRSTARAIYEKLYGSCRGLNNFIFFKIEDSVGGAIVYKGEVLGGQKGFGNEFGHMTINHNGERCECGNYGCLEMYASVPALIRQFPELNAGSWAEIVNAAYDGDSMAIQALKREADYIATGIVNLSNIFEPEAIALAGDITYRPSLLLALIKENVYSRHILRGNFNSEIIVSSQVESINVKAAAAIVIEEFYKGTLPF